MGCNYLFILLVAAVFLSLRGLSQRLYSNSLSIISSSFLPSFPFFLPLILFGHFYFSFFTQLLLSSIVSLFFLSSPSSVEGVHPVQRSGGGACAATGAGGRWGQRTLAPPPPAALLPVAAQTSEPVKRLRTDCWANANSLAYRCSQREWEKWLNEEEDWLHWLFNWFINWFCF